jgi:hypothetical protein
MTTRGYKLNPDPKPFESASLRLGKNKLAFDYNPKSFAVLDMRHEIQHFNQYKQYGDLVDRTIPVFWKCSINSIWSFLIKSEEPLTALRRLLRQDRARSFAWQLEPEEARSARRARFRELTPPWASGCARVCLGAIASD